MSDREEGGFGATPDEVEPAWPLPARGELLVLHAAAHEHNLLELCSRFCELRKKTQRERLHLRARCRRS